MELFGLRERGPEELLAVEDGGGRVLCGTAPHSRQPR